MSESSMPKNRGLSPNPLNPSRLSPSSHLSFAAAALALLACLAAVAAARFFPGGHPPLSHYVGAIAVPVAWMLGLTGLAAAMVSRRSVTRVRFLLALAGNLGALVAGVGIWCLWPFIHA